MMKLWETISEWLLTRILDWVFGSLFVALVALHVWFNTKVAPRPSQESWLIVAELLCLVTLVLGYSFYRYWINHRNKPNRNDYLHITNPPLYVFKKDRNNRSFHCYKCLFKVGHDQSRMGRIMGKGLTCPNCNEAFIEDGYCLGVMANIIKEKFNEEFQN